MIIRPITITFTSKHRLVLGGKWGTVDNIFVLHSLIKHFVNKGKRLFAAFIDITKAFNYVVRENLLLKLIKTGVRGKMLNVIKSMYNSVKAMVR